MPSPPPAAAAPILRRIAPWLVAAAALLYRVQVGAERITSGVVGRDFPSFWTAARMAAAGESPYGRSLLPWFRAYAPEIQGSEEAFPYLYPPPALLAWRWSAPLPYHASQALWWAGMLLVAVWLAWRLGRLSGIHTPWAIAGVLLFGPLALDLRIGQVNILLTALLVEAMVRGSGAWLAAAVFLKISPILAAPILFIQHRSRAALSFAGASGLIVLLSLALQDGAWLWRDFLDTLARLNQGHYGLKTTPDTALNHALSRGLWLLMPGHANLARQLLALFAVGALTAQVARRGDRSPREGLRLAGATGALIVLLAPMAWFHHLTLVLPGLAHAWGVIPRRAWFMLALLLAAPELWWRPIAWPIPELSLPLSSLFTLGVCAVFAICLRRPRGVEPTAT